jgi:hypothetical protein
VLGGVTAAVVALGLAAGFAFRPDHRALTGDEQAAPPSSAPADHLPIQVNAPPPPQPAPQPAGKLEVLNPATAEAARAARPAWSPPAASPPPSPDLTAEVGQAPQTSASAAAPAPRLAVAGPPPQVVGPRPPSGMSCVARSRAEALVCADPQLAAYDRELNSAFRRALRSGAVSPEDLRADQRDWLDDRERAARRSPEALGNLYQDRIDELNRIADDGPGDGD